jgi:hypothetical protein
MPAHVVPGRRGGAKAGASNLGAGRCGAWGGLAAARRGRNAANGSAWPARQPPFPPFSDCWKKWRWTDVAGPGARSVNGSVRRRHRIVEENRRNGPPVSVQTAAERRSAYRACYCQGRHMSDRAEGVYSFSDSIGCCLPLVCHRLAAWFADSRVTDL